MKEPLRRIALFGGSFDPVHRAHLAMARAAVAQAKLDQVIFLPAAQSPLKEHGPEASGELRLEMLQAALGETAWAGVSDWELQRPGPGYSWETARHFCGQGQPGTEWFWLMGGDQWRQLERWQKWEDLAGLVTFLVFARDGLLPEPRQGVRAVFLDTRVKAGFSEGELGASSTEIRRLRRNGGAWEKLVEPGVADVIRREGLYLP